MLNETIAKLVPILPLGFVKRVARRYIAGETSETAIALCRALQRRGFLSTLDILGEDTTTLAQATAASETYVALMHQMAMGGVPLNVSLKLSQFGLRIDSAQAFDELHRVLQAVEKLGFFVRIDMEDATVTDPTLDFYERARKITPNVGTVLQARLRRTIKDATRLAESGANIRLCRGVYNEPADIAYKSNQNIRESFLETFRVLAAGGSYVAVATHDTRLIARVEREIRTREIPKDRVEFQSLLGVPIRSTLERLRDNGYKVRVYVPFGQAWLAYSLRRLQENPELATAIIKGFFKRGRMDATRL